MKVCLVGATHPAHNPRLVREADSLARAGHEVRVVSPSFVPELAVKDTRLVAMRSWKHDPVDLLPATPSGRVRFFVARARRRVASLAFPHASYRGLAARACVLAYPDLVARATREATDWYIGHAQSALAIVVRAAARRSARVGFDCEDLLSEAGGHLSAMVRALEEAYLSRCDYVTAPSRGIAAFLAERYPIPEPTVLYNVFPEALARSLQAPSRRARGERLRLHWFGQFAGVDRGLEEAVAALGVLDDRAELHVRAAIAPGYRAELEALAERGGGGGRVHFHALVDHDELTERVGAFDVGLSLERPGHGIYARTVTNKLFTYLLAGLAVAATDVPGNREILSMVPAAGFLYPPGDSAALARGLRVWAENPRALDEAREAAWNAARSRYSWEHEEKKFIALLEEKRR